MQRHDNMTNLSIVPIYNETPKLLQNITLCDYNKVCSDCVQAYLSKNSLLRWNWNRMIYLLFILSFINGFIIQYFKKRTKRSDLPEEVKQNRLEILDTIYSCCDQIMTVCLFVSLMIVLAMTYPSVMSFFESLCFWC